MIYLWHTDIAFIDDFTRKTIHYETGIYKDMSFTSQSLENCLKKLNKEDWTFELITDNGLELKGHLFEEAQIQNGILYYLIRPRNHEENGKIEGWWQISYLFLNLFDYIKNYFAKPYCK